jgi:hypothetical protein
VVLKLFQVLALGSCFEVVMTLGSLLSVSEIIFLRGLYLDVTHCSSVNDQSFCLFLETVMCSFHLQIFMFLKIWK